MKNIVICAPGSGGAVGRALDALARRGIHTERRPTADATHLLLPVPSFEADGRIRGGGVLEHILADLPPKLTVIGGRLDHPALQGCPKLDLLLDGAYLAQNAAITADCAIRVAAQRMDVVWAGCPVLIIGWGRIGKCLAAQLKALGAAVTVAARKAADRDILAALGYGAADPSDPDLRGCRVIFNTVPAPVLGETQLRHCPKSCLKIELASKPGIQGSDVIPALGLPGKMAPGSAGQLMAQTILRLIDQEGTT